MAHHLLVFTTFAFRSQRQKWRVTIITDRPNGKCQRVQYVFVDYYRLIISHFVAGINR